MIQLVELADAHIKALGNLDSFEKIIDELLRAEIAKNSLVMTFCIHVGHTPLKKEHAIALIKKYRANGWILDPYYDFPRINISVAQPKKFMDMITSMHKPAEKV